LQGGSGGGDSEVQRTMLELLNQLDGFEPAQNIKVVVVVNSGGGAVWVGLGWFGLGWVGLVWVGLGWVCGFFIFFTPNRQEREGEKSREEWRKRKENPETFAPAGVEGK
jgi:hypothetical protein